MSKVIYLDMFVSDPDVPSIDQHIVAVDREHLEQLKNNPLKINPNLERDRMLTNDYYHKYPFGTLHYLIARMCREGIDVKLPDLNKALIKYPDITLGKLLLRPDDAMYSSLSAYKDNAIEWWQWLIDYSKNSKQIIALRDYIYNNEFPDSKKDKENINAFFMNVLHCQHGDGAFDVISDENGRIYDIVKSVIEAMGYISGWNTKELVIPEKYDIKMGEWYRASASYSNVPEIKQMIKHSTMYSYSFTFGPNKKNNFSFTTNMRY